MHLGYVYMMELQNGSKEFVKGELKPGLQLFFIYHDHIVFFKEMISSKITMISGKLEGVSPKVVFLTNGLQISFLEDRQ